MEVVMRLLRSIAGPLALLLIAAPGAAAPRDGLIVTTAWLAQHLTDPDLVLLHVGDKAEYDARHIPGARYVALSDISVTGPAGTGLTLEMPPAADLRERLANLGISDRSRIVVYYGKDWVSPSTRVIFTLDYAGLGDATSLLDGGMDAWTRDGHDVTAVVPPARHGTLSPHEPRALIVDADYVLAHLKTPQTAIVDARDTTFYDGTQTGGRGEARHRTGHIAGAHSVPFSSLTDEKLHVKPTGELAAIFERAGVQPHDTVVAYCHVGQQATAVIFAARVLGHPVLLYDGSFEDWSRHPDYPVDVPAKRDGGR
jgi:thiosulfate/3-mercaptopyruvate sulfurtransferase